MAWRFEHAVLPSTQDEAIRRAREGAEEGTVVVARRQERGRGRLSHSWSSPLGGLYLSTIVREPRYEPGLLPVAIGARLALALRHQMGVATVVKWPNDLLVLAPGRPARKLAGILVDRVASPTLGTALVVGVGLNVTRPSEGFPPELEGRVAVLTDVGVPPPQERLVESLVVGAIRAASESLNTEVGHAQAVQECRNALYGLGHRALVDGEPAGVIRSLGDDGALYLERNGERVAVRAGDLTVLEEA